MFTDRSKMLYIAGPMTGLPDFNYPAFNATADRLRKQGFAVINPADFGLARFPELTWERCVRIAMGGLLRCGAMAVMRGWQQSRGCRMEVGIARHLNMPVIDADSLELWGMAPAHWQGQIVGLWGAATVGKDSIQKHLGIPRAAFADAIKDDLAPVFNRLGLDIANADHKRIGRNLLVEHGRLGRAVDPDYWIKRLILPPARACITDVRYLNECRWIWSKGGVVFEVLRTGILPANGEEERSFAQIRQYAKAHGIDIPQVFNDVDGHPEVAAMEISHRIVAHFAGCRAA